MFYLCTANSADFSGTPCPAHVRLLKGCGLRTVPSVPCSCTTPNMQMYTLAPFLYLPPESCAVNAKWCTEQPTQHTQMDILFVSIPYVYWEMGHIRLLHWKQVEQKATEISVINLRKKSITLSWLWSTEIYRLSLLSIFFWNSLRSWEANMIAQERIHNLQ